MSRHAILVGNTARTPGNKFTNVNKTILLKKINEITKNLSELGEKSFSVHQIVDNEYDEARTNLNKICSKISNDETDFILFYYFGHGLERSNQLKFQFKDSDEDKEATFLSFSYIADQIFGHKLNNILFVLDCCSAGAAAKDLFSISSGNSKRFSIIASAQSLYAATVKPSITPFGAFSHYYFSGLRNIEAASTGSMDITVNSLLQYTKLIFDSENIQQKPFDIDGGLHNYVLAEATSNPHIIPKFNSFISKKSFYSKMNWILMKLEEKGKSDLDSLYSIVVSEKPVQMLTPFKDGENIIHRPIHKDTFLSYLNILNEIKIINKEDGFSLSQIGRKIIRNSGSEYNTYLLNALDEYLVSNGTSFGTVEKSILHASKIREIPNIGFIYDEIKRRDNVVIIKSTFQTILDLAAYAGRFKYTATKTFYLY